MSKTSSAVKRKYNEKVYSVWRCDIKKEMFAEIEAIREAEGMSRAEFLKKLVNEVYNKNF